MRARLPRAVVGLAAAGSLLLGLPAAANPAGEPVDADPVATSPTIAVPADADWDFGPRPVVTTLSPEEVAERERIAEAAELRESGYQVSADGSYVFPLQLGSYRSTSSFGYRSIPWPGMHNGSDFAAPSGTPLVALADAQVMAVSYAGYGPLDLTGTVVVLRLTDRTIVAYGHVSRVDVAVGQRVEMGEVVGAVGSTGNSTGPHLHLVVAPVGTPVDPVPWLAERGLAP